MDIAIYRNWTSLFTEKHTLLFTEKSTLLFTDYTSTFQNIYLYISGSDLTGVAPYFPTYPYQDSYYQGTHAPHNPNLTSNIDFVLSRFQLAPYVTNVQELNKENLLYLYPNPTTGITNIDLSNFSTTEKLQIHVFNSLGELVYSNNISGSRTKDIVQINLDILSQGIYTIKFETNNNIVSKLLVKL